MMDGWRNMEGFLKFSTKSHALVYFIDIFDTAFSFQSNFIFHQKQELFHNMFSTSLCEVRVSLRYFRLTFVDFERSPMIQ